MLLPPPLTRLIVREAQRRDVCKIEVGDVDFFLQRREGFGQEVLDRGQEERGDLGFDKEVLFEGAAVCFADGGGLVGAFDAGFELGEEALELGD